MATRVTPDYFTWLMRQVGERHEEYRSLLFRLHLKPFDWFIPHDDNRGEDAKELREEYTDTYRITGEDLWPASKASLLEVLIRLSRRLEDDTEVNAERWFWKLLENLGLHHYTDFTFGSRTENDVDAIMEHLLEREYGYDGNGGLFPLRRPQHDQRQVEIWYQMQAYLLESDYVDNWPR